MTIRKNKAAIQGAEHLSLEDAQVGKPMVFRTASRPHLKRD